MKNDGPDETRTRDLRRDRDVLYYKNPCIIGLAEQVHSFRNRQYAFICVYCYLMSA